MQTRHSPLLCALLATIFSAASLCAQMSAFVWDDSVAVLDLSQDSKDARKLVPGSDPAISPDGKMVAFTHTDAAGNRFIAIVDVATGEWKEVEGVPGENNYLPIWSPDAQYLVFNHFLGSNWHPAKVDAAGGNFDLLPGADREMGAYGFMPDGNAFLCHDLRSFFVVPLTGPMKEIPVTQELHGLSIPSRVAVSPDGQSALIELLLDDEMAADDPGPPSAIFQLTLATGEIRRVSPKGFNASYPAWLPDGTEFLFSAFHMQDKEFHLFRAPIDGSTQPVLILRRASTPTAARR